MTEAKAHNKARLVVIDPRFTRTAAVADLVTVPRAAFELFVRILGEMANGNAVTILPIHAELTTQQAAEFLNVSRPHLVKLLEEGRIPFRMVGAHRRVRFEDLVRFKQQDDEERRKVLDELPRKPSGWASTTDVADEDATRVRLRR